MLQQAPYKAHEWEAKKEASKIIVCFTRPGLAVSKVKDNHIKEICLGETSLKQDLMVISIIP